jgi:hypothetical protein
MERQIELVYNEASCLVFTLWTNARTNFTRKNNSFPMKCVLYLTNGYSSIKISNRRTPCSQSARELYWRSDRRLSTKLMPTFLRIEGVEWSARRIPAAAFSIFRPKTLLFLQLYSRGWVDPDEDPLLLRNSGSVGNRTQDLWICSQKLWPLTTEAVSFLLHKIKCSKKQSYPRNRPWRPTGLFDVKDPTLSRQSAHRWQ